MAETAWFRGEGGGLHEFDLPLPDVYAAQERAGRLTRVDPPAPVDLPVPAAPEVPAPAADPKLGSLDKPARSDPKADWLAYAKQVSDLPAAELEAMNKQALVDSFGG